MPSQPSLAIARARPSLGTLAAVGAVACVAADLVHEALGHGIVSWLAGDRILSLSTVALQNAAPNRLVAAAGSSANVLVGLLSLAALRRLSPRPARSAFLWVFGAFNLLNVGYLVFSAASNSGDWAQVIASLSPAWLWRLGLAVLGCALYALAIQQTTGALRTLLARGTLAAADAPAWVWSAYLAGGAVLTLAACFNPIGPGLILVSGVGASFGLNAGLLAVLGRIADTPCSPAASAPIPLSLPWLVLACAVSGAFVGILGPGLYFVGP